MSFMLPTGVHKLISDNEARELYDLAKDKTVIEFGTWAGFSALCMAQSAKLVVTVDLTVEKPLGFVYDPADKYPARKQGLATMWDNLLQRNMLDRIVPILGSTGFVAKQILRPGSFDFAFIDAGHLYDQVMADIACALPLLKPGSKIAFHDYNPQHFPGVVRAVDEWREYRTVRFIDFLAVVDL